MTTLTKIQTLPGMAATRERLWHEYGRRTFIHWLKYVKIQEPPKSGGGGSKANPIIPMEAWPHIIELSNLLVENRLVNVLKARQVGVSWLLAAYSLWTALYHKGAVVLLLSWGKEPAKVFLGKCKTIYRFLPENLKEPIHTDSYTEFSFGDKANKVPDRKINALPSTENAGRSETATLVVQDEADFHEHLEENFTAIKPTIDSGGQLVMVSTPDPFSMTSIFKAMVRGAPGNGWAKLYLPWYVRPGRDADWYAATEATIPEGGKLSPRLYMEKEYSSSEEEALAPARALAAFDRDVLRDMMNDVKDPLKDVPNLPVLCNIYRPYSVGRKYVAFTDTSHAVGQDFAVTVVMDVRTGGVVADIMSNVLPPEELALRSVDLLKMYRDPIWGIENNDWGRVTIARAVDLGYKNLWRDPDKNNQLGWNTDTKTSFILWGELIQAVKDRNIQIFSEDGLGQFFNIIRNPKRNGKIEALEGGHDDYPLSVGGAWQLRKYAHTSTGRPVKQPRLW